MIAITFALPAESSAFLREVGHKHSIVREGVRSIRGEIGATEVEILHTGVGQNICRQRLTAFLNGRTFEYLIASGFAGALREEFHAGDIVFAQNFSDSTLWSQANERLRNLSVRSVAMHSASAIVESPAQREEIATKHGAAIIDMETETIAEICRPRALPLLSLRVISDSPSEPLPAPAEILFDTARQKTKLLPLAGYVFRHPAAIGRLLAFNKQIARSRAALGDALVRLLRQN